MKPTSSLCLRAIQTKYLPWLLLDSGSLHICGRVLVITRDKSIPTSWPHYLTWAAIILTMVFSMLMPGISDTLKGGRLVLFWSAHFVLALLILQSVQMLLMNVPTTSSRSPWGQVVLSGLIGAMLFAPFASVLDQVFGIADVTDDFSETFAERLISEFTGLVGIVMMVWIGLNATRLLQIQPRVPDAAPIRDAQPDFWNRVPMTIGRDLVALSAELHYMRVYTTQGEALVLFPFGRAVVQLENVIDGVQIHRSHWVALGHVAEIRRNGRNGVCHTTSGLDLPISRKRRQSLEAALTPSMP